MNQKQELKMRILDKFGISDNPKTVDFCREAFAFLTEGEGNPTPECAYATSSEVPVAVDLGLPSGKLWADRNIGAFFPQDYGLFFSWGNVEGHKPKCGDVDWGDNDNVFDYEFTLEEYNKTPGAKLEGDIDAAHDAATVNLGEPWCMPTEDDFQELYDNCIWIRKTINGVNGYLVTSNINAATLFFACSGLGNGTSWLYRGSNGYYWSSSLSSATNGRYLYFYSGGVYPQNNYGRFYGIVVRPVQNSSQPQNK